MTCQSGAIDGIAKRAEFANQRSAVTAPDTTYMGSDNCEEIKG